MKTKYYILGLFFLFAIGCSKVKSTKKKLSGTWTVLTYKRMNSLGLTYQYTPTSGGFIFDECNQDYCNYSIDFVYDDQGTTTQFNSIGTYTFTDDVGEYFDILQENGTGGIDTIEDARIILLTKDDLLLEYTFNSARHTFVLAKD